jgi:hypothetical protein
VPLECRALEFYAQTIAAIQLRGTIDDMRVLRKFANQGSKQRYFVGPPVSFRDYASTMGTDVFRDGAFANPRLIQVGEVELNRQRLTLLHSRIEALQTRNLPLRTAMTYLLAYVLHGLDGRHSFCRLHGLPPVQVLKKPGVTARAKKPRFLSLEC